MGKFRTSPNGPVTQRFITVWESAESSSGDPTNVTSAFDKNVRGRTSCRVRHQDGQRVGTLDAMNTGPPGRGRWPRGTSRPRGVAEKPTRERRSASGGRRRRRFGILERDGPDDLKAICAEAGALRTRADGGLVHLGHASLNVAPEDGREEDSALAPRVAAIDGVVVGGLVHRPGLESFDNSLSAFRDFQGARLEVGEQLLEPCLGSLHRIRVLPKTSAGQPICTPI